MSSVLIRFRPALLDALKDYDRQRLGKDVAAGLTVGVVALPLAMAFAVASGLKPEAGLFTAIVAGFLVSALGGSRVQIGGPAGAFIVIVYGIVQQHGVGSLLLATAMSGVLLLVMGALRLGTLVRFIPVAVVIGFTNGIAVLIALSQVKDFLGLQVPAMPADFVGAARAIWAHGHTVNPWAVGVALLSLLAVAGWRHVAPWLATRLRVHGLLTALPGSIVALALATALVAAFDWPVETIGSRFGGIPAALPALQWPQFTWDSARQLLMPTITLALLGAIESLLCARVADGMKGPQRKTGAAVCLSLSSNRPPGFVPPACGRRCRSAAPALFAARQRRAAAQSVFWAGRRLARPSRSGQRWLCRPRAVRPGARAGHGHVHLRLRCVWRRAWHGWQV